MTILGLITALSLGIGLFIIGFIILNHIYN